MLNSDLRGIWTYRSFSDNPKTVGDFEKIKVWEAELYLETKEDSRSVYGHLGERPEETSENHPYLNIEGEVDNGTPRRVAWRAKGAAGTAFEGWVYDYEGHITHQWPDGDGQRLAIVGTVIRTVEHGSAPAGRVFSFVAVKADFVEARSVIPLAEPVLELTSSRVMRLHHQLWHGVRNAWHSLPDEVQNAIQKWNWQPGPKGQERPALDRSVWRTNGSGEDFLYMHRRMIENVKKLDPNLSGWTQLPSARPLAEFREGFSRTAVGNPNGFAIPPAWNIPGNPGTSDWLHRIRRPSSFYAPFRTWEELYTNPSYLAVLSLGELGSRIEFTIHNWMHMRWASAPRDPETNEVIPMERDPLDHSEKWFEPEYDYLGDTFSSHVHPIFWRLHGWVDDRIEDWYRAQEIARPGVVKRANVNNVNWFSTDGEWVAIEEPWEGPRATERESSHGGHGMGHDTLDLDPEVMLRVLKILFTQDPNALPNGEPTRAVPEMLKRAYTGFDDVEGEQPELL